MSSVSINNLSYFYPDEKKPVLRDISLNIREREVVGIAGPSGCGKSTLLLAISGLIPHVVKGDLHGNIIIGNKRVSKLTMAELSQRVQLLFQCPESQLFALNVEDEITFGLENLNFPWNQIQDRLDNTISKLDIDYLRHSSIEELSSGQKQRVALASVLAMEPQVLLFDEPTANLDPKAIDQLIGVINKLKKKHTIVIVEHNTAFLNKICDRLCLMEKGNIILDGKTKSIVKSTKYRNLIGSLSKIGKLSKLPTTSKRRTSLEIKNLDFTYPNNAKALSDINLTIGKGDFLGIIGTNGSGKSTLALNIIGLLKGDGDILLEGNNISKKDTFSRSKRIGYIFQNPNYQLFEDTLYDEIAFGPKNAGLSTRTVAQRVDEALRKTGLIDFKNNDPHALSVGQKRRVSIASVLAMKPDIIIVDEPDTGLDPKTAQLVMDYLKKLNKAGKTIIMISHNLDLTAQYCNRIIAMQEGKLVDVKTVLDLYPKQ